MPMKDPVLEHTPKDPAFGKPEAEVIGDWTFESEKTDGTKTKEKLVLLADGTVKVKHPKSDTPWTDLDTTGFWVIDATTGDVTIKWDDKPEVVIKPAPGKEDEFTVTTTDGTVIKMGEPELEHTNPIGKVTCPAGCKGCDKKGTCVKDCV